MFSDQTLSNIVSLPNMLILNWVAKRLTHVWSNIGLTLWAKNYGPQITQRSSLKRRGFNMAECATSQVAIQRFKLKMIIATIIHLDILEEDGKRENKRGKTRSWTRRREEELMIEDIPGYSRLPRNDANDSWRFSRDTDACWTCMHFVTIDFITFPLFSLKARRFFGFNLCNFSPVHQISLLVRDLWNTEQQDAVRISMDTSHWASVVPMHAPNMFDTGSFDTAVQTNKTSPIKHEKCFKLFGRMFDGLQILSTRPNTSKHDQTAPNKVDKVAKRWNVCIGHQTFPIWTGFKFKHGKSWPARYLDILFLPNIFTIYFIF